MVARIGGEEFIWILPGLTADEARCAAERARRAVAGDTALDGPPLANEVWRNLWFDGTDLAATSLLSSSSGAALSRERHARLAIARLVERVTSILAAVDSAGSTRRVLLGIAGAPGSGKTTLAVALTAALEASSASELPFAAHVPMDGFHLADVELRRLGRASRKGAPDTFDAGGYLALLTRLRSATDTVWAPAFDREIEQPIAGSIAVAPSVRVVVSEGNYLLLDDPAWLPVAAMCDEVWFCDPDDELRVQRLIERHERFGKSAAQAKEWALGVDQRNADLVNAARTRAALIVGDADF